MVDRLPDDLDAEVRRVGSGGATADVAGDRLTDRQRVVLETALDAGYFAEPREATLGDVARELELSAGTVAEHVRKAERRLVTGALGDRAPDGDDR